MTNELPPDDEQAMIDEILKRRQLKDRRSFPARDVERFRQAITAELERTGDLTRETVRRLLEQFRAGEL